MLEVMDALARSEISTSTRFTETLYPGASYSMGRAELSPFGRHRVASVSACFFLLTGANIAGLLKSGLSPTFLIVCNGPAKPRGHWQHDRASGGSGTP